jgi:hypothetical protein
MPANSLEYRQAFRVRVRPKMRKRFNCFRFMTLFSNGSRALASREV